MNRIFSNKKYLITLIVAVVLIVITVSVNFFTSGVITFNVNDMVANAQKLYDEGDFKNAYYQLQLYCQENSTDSEAWMLLGDLCLDMGDDEKADTYYKKASKLTNCSENQLGEQDKVKTFQDFHSIESIKIYPTAKYTKGMTLNILGDGFVPESQKGKVTNKIEETSSDERYITTQWFPVDDSQSNIYITGDINCGIWQFCDDEGSCVKYEDKSGFRVYDNPSHESMPYSTAEIPKDAVMARVTYYDETVTTNAQSDGKIFVGYGETLTGYTGVKNYTFDIPDLKEDHYVQYEKGKWVYFDGKKVNNLEWEGLGCSDLMTLSIQGEICGTVEVNVSEQNKKDGDKSLKYGIKYSRTSGISSGARLDAARGMTFDYMVDDEWRFGTGNDFDKAYPWCEIELCNVDSAGTVTLANDEKFATDGSNGNVMVRIPKFYSKRVVEDDYEYIWISGAQHEGYSIEPVFENSDGSIADYVYMSAYLGAEQDEKIVSVANSYPTVKMQYGTTLEYAENNGEGFSEMNYLMCSALQKLFIIETGTIDSSSVFAGESTLYYFYKEKNAVHSASVAKSEEKTNRITLYNNSNTMKLREGLHITIFKGESGFDNTSARREILSVESDTEYIYVTFDGEPLSVEKHVTCVSGIPSKTGKTDGINYCTGTLEGTEGKMGFKYRGIENLYGSDLVMLDDDAYVSDNIFSFYSGGQLNSLSVPVATQEYNFSNWEYIGEMSIKEMSFDANHPQIMVPTVAGEGASAYNYYGDTWIYKPSSAKKYLLYGGALDNERMCGIFQLRADLNSHEERCDFYTARIMYK